MKFNIQQIIYFCLINYVGTFPNDLFDELWQTNQSEPEANNNPIESQPKIKVEPHEEQFDGRWQDEFALKGNVKVEHEAHYGAVIVEGTDEIKNEFEWWGEESGELKEQLQDHVKEENQVGQAPNTPNHKKIGDENDENWPEDDNKFIEETDQDESVDGHQNDSNEFETIESDQQKRKIIQKFREMKEDYKKKRKYSKNEWVQIDAKILNGLGVSRTKLYKWIKELGLSRETNSKLSELEKREILNQFDEIKSKCKKAKLKSGLKHELDEKIAKKLGISATTIRKWKREFGLSVSNKKFSELEKREILKQFDEIKSKCKKAKLKSGLKHELDEKIAKKLGISATTIRKWKREFGLSVSNKKFSELEKREILKQFDEIKSKCKEDKFKNISMHELDDKIAKKLGICGRTIYAWKRKFGLSISNKISDATKIGILKKYAKIKGKNPKMSNCDIADLLKISINSLKKWKAQFIEENNHF